MAKYLRSSSGKAQQKRRKAFLLRLYGGIFLVLVLSTLFIWLMNKPFFRISDIAVRGLDTLSAEQILFFGHKETEGKYLYFIPRDNILFYPRAAINQSLLAFDARIKESSVDMQSNGLLTVTIEEHSPFYLYCTEMCFYTNENGYIYREAAGVPESLYVVFKDETSKRIIRENYAPEFFEKIVSLLTFFTEKNIHVKSVIKTGEVDFNFITNNDTEIKIDFDGDFETLKGYLSIFIDSNLDLVKNDSLEYIDARFGKKIFYKQRDNEEVVIEDN